MRARKGALWSPGLVWVACTAVLWAFVGTGWATVWNVSTVGDIQNAVNNAAPYDTIIIAPGTYYMTSRLNIYDHHLTIQGSTGNRDDVVLVGGGMNTDVEPREMMDLHTDDVTIRDLTISECYHHGVHIRTEQDVDRTTVSNVKTLNCGERHIKGSTNFANVSEGILIENCHLLQTKANTGGDTNYIGGIDMMTLDGCTIRDSVMQDIQGSSGGGRGGIFLWNESNNCTAERNLIIGCDRGIAFGNPSGTVTYHNDTGIIRNNFIVRGADIAMELCRTKDLKVYNNTIYSADAGYFRTVHINNSSTTNLHLAYNIIRGQILPTEGATFTDTGNITGSTPANDWFVDPLNGDLHLTELATSAIDAAALLPEVPVDIDGDARPSGDYPDVGADEYLWPLPSLVSSDPAADGTLCKTQNNVILITFDDDIALPVGQPALSIFGGGFEEGDAFTYSVEPDGVTLKAVEQGAILTDLTWYQITPAAGFGVEPFAFDLCALIGDANNSGRVTTADYTEVKLHMGEYTDARYDLNDSGRVTTADYSVVKTYMGNRAPTKP
ncbi:MAG TPA: dockerin type I domain-containing protein [Phycisphaerae bacterium]|nr:dockerin type I domain-containing protein [Phycisphaerae bacterium]